MADEPMLNYHLFKMGAEGWRQLARPDPTSKGDPNYAAARAAFLAGYNLPELSKPDLTQRTKQDLKAALDARRIPPWALNLLTAEEFQELEGVKTT